MNILIIGAGAIGSLFGGKLAESGQAVTLVGRPSFVDAVRQQGLCLAIGDDIHRISNVVACPSVAAALDDAQQRDQPFELAVLTVKSYDTETALEELEQALHQSGAHPPMVLSLQNGVGNEEAAANRFGEERVIAGTITAPVTVPEPGMVRVAKPKYVVGISPWTPAAHSATFDSLHEAIAQAGISVKVYGNARSMKWTKLLMNMVGNATSAILDEPPEIVFADPRMVDLEIDAWREALAVMKAAGIRPVNVEKYPFGLLAPLVRTVPKAVLRPVLARLVGGARGGKMPSLHIDLSRGKRKSEVNWLNGAVVRTGERLGVPTPVNRVLNETMHQLIENPERWATWKHNHEGLWSAAHS